MRRVVVTGLGLAAPLSFEEICQSKSAIKLIGGQLQAKLPAMDFELYNPKNSNFITFGLHACMTAWKDSGLELTDEEKEDSGICFGSGIGGLQNIIDAGKQLDVSIRKISPLFFPSILSNMVAGQFSIHAGLRGPSHSVSTACTTGAHSIGDAMRFIQFGDAKVMIAGASEEGCIPIGFAGFGRAKGLAVACKFESAEQSSRPFDKDRNGFVLGNGAGAVVLEEMEHAKKRNARIYCELVGYGLSSDAHHITAPHPEGYGAFLAMKRALERAKVNFENVDYVNAHATSTVLGDQAEVHAIHKLFGSTDLLISSAKGAIGHLLGAAGAVEAIYTILALVHSTIPPTLNLHDSSTMPHQYNFVPLNAIHKNINVAISNSFGFGGTNASLVFRKL